MNFYELPAGSVEFEVETAENPNPQVRELENGLYEANFRFRIVPQPTVRDYLLAARPCVRRNKMKPADLAKILKHCISTRDAANLLASTSPTGSCTTARVAQLAAAGQIAGAVKWGKEWILPRASVLAYSKVERFGGRPPA